MNRRPAIAVVGVATVAVSFSAIFIRLADSRDSAATIVWVRMALTVLVLAPVAARAAARGAESRWSRRDAVLTGAAGTLLAVHFLAWTASLALTSVASSVLLVCVHPVLVAPLARRLLGEQVGWRLVAGIALAVLGTAVTAAGDLRLSGRAALGDLLALVGAAAFAGYLLIGRSVRRRRDATVYSVTAYSIVATIAIACTPFTGAGPLPHARTLLACAGLALVCTVLGHTAFNWALRHVRAAVVSLAFLGEPPITTLLAIPILMQRPPPTAVIGGAVILIGVGLAMAESPSAIARERDLALTAQ